MEQLKLERRAFLKKASLGFTGAAAVSLFTPVRSTLARSLSELVIPSDDESSFAELAKEYMLGPDVTYFNHGSIGTIPKLIHRAHKGYLELCESNPWLYMWSEPWEEARAQTREKVARFLGCDSDELVFTHNTTEGFNLLAHGLPLSQEDEVLFSSLNHTGASQCWFHYGQTKGFSVKRFEFPIRETPALSHDDLVEIHAKQITEKTRVLVIPHIDNIVGIRHPVKALAQMAKAKGVEFIAVDAAQSVGMIPLNLDEMGIDFYATSPHKWLQAPKGTGLMYIRKSSRASLTPMWVTWGQNRWRGTARIFEDYGTRNLAEVLTLGDAVDFLEKLGLEEAQERRKALWTYFKRAVVSHPRMTWRSPKSWGLGSSLYAFEVADVNSREFFQEMYRKHGFVFRPFHSESWNTVRMSLNVFNTYTEIDRFIEIVA
ncbi:aminotransferase class V-fold PLP-dependent enzyme [bacterium]|nr:aminotransferase class V-fold PLP-dependent enzyme [bacterium]